MIQLSTLKLNTDNPRTISGHRFEQLKKSITEFPEMLNLREIIIDENNVVLGGNMRLRALADLGYTEIPEDWVKIATGLTETQKREIIIKDNASFGEWDFDALANDWDDLPLIEWAVDVPDLDNLPDPFKDDEKEKKILECPNCGHQW